VIGLRPHLWGVVLSGAALTLGATAFVGSAAIASVALGAVLAAGNLWALARIVRALLPTDALGAKAQSRAGWALVALLKTGTILGVVWLLMRHRIVLPLPMVVGFLALPIGIAIGSLVSDRSAGNEDP
jgi:hypothetical protein